MSDYKPEYKTEFKTSILDEAKLALRSKVEGSTGTAMLKVSILNNQPRVTVFTGVAGDPNKGCIIARMDGPAFATFLTTALDLIETEDFKKFGVYNKSHPKDGEGKQNTKEFKVDSLLQIAKDADGRLFISVTDKQITPVKFYFEPTNYHNFVYNGGESTPAEISKFYAKGWIKLIFKLFPMVMESQFEPYKKPNQNGNAGGGYNNNRPQYNKPAAEPTAEASFDDDVSWD